MTAIPPAPIAHSHRTNGRRAAEQRCRDRAARAAGWRMAGSRKAEPGGVARRFDNDRTGSLPVERGIIDIMSAEIESQQLPMIMPQALTLEHMLSYIGWPTIRIMIYDLTWAIDHKWFEPKWNPGPEIIAARDAMIRYMERAWPDKLEREPDPGNFRASYAKLLAVAQAAIREGE